MSLFQFPKSKHSRKLSPRKFKRYQTYKRFLQTEFNRVCVYCRQPDSSAPNLNFGVDHYRPKGIPRFAKLVCEYDNLYYCCGNCNSRKNNYWPLDEKAGPHIVNPCDHEMATHLRFDSTTGEVEPKTPYGNLTEQLLQLNDRAAVTYRLSTLRIVKSLRKEIEELELQSKQIVKLFRIGKIAQAVHDSEIAEIRAEIEQLTTIVDLQTGAATLPPLQKKKFSISLLKP